MPAKADLKEKEFEENIPAISRIVFMIGGFHDGCVTRTLILDESQLRMEINHFYQFDEPRHINEPQIGYSKDELLEEIRTAHIGKWKKRYVNNRILDGTQWELEIYFSNGHKPVKIYGSNDYPVNFDRISTLMKKLGDI